MMRRAWKAPETAADWALSFVSRSGRVKNSLVPTLVKSTFRLTPQIEFGIGRKSNGETEALIAPFPRFSGSPDSLLGRQLSAAAAAAVTCARQASESLV